MTASGNPTGEITGTAVRPSTPPSERFRRAVSFHSAERTSTTASAARSSRPFGGPERLGHIGAHFRSKFRSYVSVAAHRWSLSD